MDNAKKLATLGTQDTGPPKKCFNMRKYRYQTKVNTFE